MGVDEAFGAFCSSVASLLRLIADFWVYNYYTTQRTILVEGSEGVLLVCAHGIYIPGHLSPLGPALQLLVVGALHEALVVLLVRLRETLRFTSYFGLNEHGTCGFNKSLVSSFNMP